MVREDFISTSLSIKDIRGAYIAAAFGLPPWIVSLANKLMGYALSRRLSGLHLPPSALDFEPRR